MPYDRSAAPIAWTSAPLAAAAVDLLVVPWFESDRPSAFEGLDRTAAGEVQRALTSGEFRGKPFELFVTPSVDTQWKAARIALIGAGPVERYDASLARRLASAAVLAARQRRIPRLGFVLRGGVPDASGDFEVGGIAQAIAEGLTLAEFDGATYKTQGDTPAGAPALTIIVPDLEDSNPESQIRIDASVSRGRILGECSNLARQLVNEPGNALTPDAFARRATALAAEAGIGVEILDEHRIADLKMGMLLGVARGSSEPPRLMVFRHDPPGAPKGPVLGLIGKGVTFDTGGISIKPSAGMEKMKDDMSGGAAVACAMRAMAALGAPIRVVGVVPATENMPGGRALKPGDILTSAEGKTVEVIDTDAEGRLILGDALWYARQLGATHLVDVATLTGGILVALGKSTTGLFGTPPAWVEHVRRVGERAGDRGWPMPLFEDYREQLDSAIADMQNVGGRQASSITAAMFLKEFTGGLPWVHLDIAGTAWAEEGKPYMPKGPTGVAVRTLAELPFTAGSWPL